MSVISFAIEAEYMLSCRHCRCPYACISVSVSEYVSIPCNLLECFESVTGKDLINCYDVIYQSVYHIVIVW